MWSAGRRRLAATLLIACGAIACAEVGIQRIFEPTFWERTSWFMHDTYRGEPFDRLILAEKLQALDSFDPDVITVGDSSGFFSLNPQIIDPYLGGRHLLNLSTGANEGFDGYHAHASFALRHSTKIKYAVLHMYPNIVPSPKLHQVADLGPIAATNFESWKQALLAPPSAMFTYDSKLRLFLGLTYRRGDPLNSHKVNLELANSMPVTHGWIPEHDIRFPRNFPTLLFYADIERGFFQFFDKQNILSLAGLRDKSSIVYELTRFADLCRSYGVTPIIAFQPMAWSPSLLDPEVKEAIAALERFSAASPDVKFLFPYITIWDPAKFAMFNHAAREYVHLTSGRLGSALAEFFKDPTARRPFEVGAFSTTPPPAPAAKPVRPATAEEKNAALAYYMYTATADESYRQAISARNLGLMAADPDFAAMMEATRVRLRLLRSHADKIELGYDVSALQADIVGAINLPTCGSPERLLWVQLSGSVGYSFRSNYMNTDASVGWPRASLIVIPIVNEQGIPKFDGYCAEQWRMTKSVH